MILRFLSFYAYVAKGHLVSAHEAVFSRHAMLLGRRKLLRDGLMPGKGESGSLINLVVFQKTRILNKIYINKINNIKKTEPFSSTVFVRVYFFFCLTTVIVSQVISIKHPLLEKCLKQTMF